MALSKILYFKTGIELLIFNLSIEQLPVFGFWFSMSPIMRPLVWKTHRSWQSKWNGLFISQFSRPIYMWIRSSCWGKWLHICIHYFTLQSLMIAVEFCWCTISCEMNLNGIPFRRMALGPMSNILPSIWSTDIFGKLRIANNIFPVFYIIGFQSYTNADRNNDSKRVSLYVSGIVFAVLDGQSKWPRLQRVNILNWIMNIEDNL